jgi:hypothetical protein
VTFSDVGLVIADIYHRLMVIYIDLMCYKSTFNHKISYRNYSAGDYSMLYDTLLLKYDWSEVHNTSVDVAVNSLNTAMHFAMNQSIPRHFIGKSKYHSFCVQDCGKWRDVV